jgi:hypothetical protein
MSTSRRLPPENRRAAVRGRSCVSVFFFRERGDLMQYYVNYCFILPRPAHGKHIYGQLLEDTVDSYHPSYHLTRASIDPFPPL